MSGIGDQGMMPEHVRSRRPDDDTVDERVAHPEKRLGTESRGREGADADPAQSNRAEGDQAQADRADAEQAEVDAVLRGISDDDRADSTRMGRIAAHDERPGRGPGL